MAAILADDIFQYAISWMKNQNSVPDGPTDNNPALV